MKSPTITTVEIFHDVECGPQDIDPVLAGVEIINAITDSLAVIRTDRQIKISAPGAQAVEPEKLRFGVLPADMSVVLTSRDLLPTATTAEKIRRANLRDGLSEVAEYAPGFAVREGQSRVALLTPRRSLSKGALAAHELAHLYNLKTWGVKLDPTSEGHCIDDDCLMLAAEPVTRRMLARDLLLTTPTEVDRAMQRMGIPALPEAPSECFCDECAGQLAELAEQERIRKRYS